MKKTMTVRLIVKDSCVRFQHYADSLVVIVVLISVGDGCLDCDRCDDEATDVVLQKVDFDKTVRTRAWALTQVAVDALYMW